MSTTQIGGEPHSVFPDQSKHFYRVRCLSEWCFSRGSLERVPAPPRCKLALRGTVSGASRLWHAKNVAYSPRSGTLLGPACPMQRPSVPGRSRRRFLFALTQRSSTPALQPNPFYLDVREGRFLGYPQLL